MQQHRPFFMILRIFHDYLSTHLCFALFPTQPTFCQSTTVWARRHQTKQVSSASGRPTYILIKSFILLAVIRRSVQRICGAHFRDTAPSGNTTLFEKMSQRWRAVGNTVSDLTSPRFEPQTSRSRHERVTTRSAVRYVYPRNWKNI